MDQPKMATEGYGDGFIDGWKSVAGSSPIPSHIGIVPAHQVPIDMSFYEYGYQKGCEAAEKVKLH